VLLFGPIARAASAASLSITDDRPSISVAELIERVSSQTPAIASFLRSSRIARNQAFVTAADVVSHEDELAVIGMVSGG
jgi:molybdopterin converting factor small subunit